MTALHWVHVNADLIRMLQRFVTILFALFSVVAHLSLAGEPARVATKSLQKSALRAAGQCMDSEFSTGSSCSPCTDCATVGTYTATRCSERQDAQCSNCSGKPVDASWVTSGFFEETSCTWLCDAGFAADASTQCVRCSPCPTSVNAACGHNETEYVTFASTQYVSMCYAACVGQNKFFTGTWGKSTTKTTCECVTKNPQQNFSQLNNSVCHELSKEPNAGCSADQKTVVSFSVNPNLLLVGTRVRVSGNSALSPCLAACQTDDLCSCVGTYSVDNSGFVSGPGCFHSSHPCQVMSISRVRATLLQPSPEFLDSVVYTKAATACLTCPPGARPGANGTCICDIAGTFSNFAQSLNCSDADSGELQSQDRMPLGMPIPQAIEHCAAAARAYAAPLFCVTVPSGKCAIYFPKNTSEVCAPSRGDIECFAPVLVCQTCSAPLRIEASDREGWGFNLRVSGQEHLLDNASWKWLPSLSSEDACNTAQCFEGYLLFRFLVSKDPFSYQYKCVDHHLLHVWITTYILLWSFGVGVTVCVTWKMRFRCNTRCVCGVGWMHPCLEHETASSSSEEKMDCPNCKCDAGLLCESPDMQQSAHEWGVRIFCIHVSIMAMLVVLRLLRGEFSYFFDFRLENSRVDCQKATLVALYSVPSIIQVLLYYWLMPIYSYSRLLVWGQAIMWVSFLVIFWILSEHLVPDNKDTKDENYTAPFLAIMGWMLLPLNSCQFNRYHGAPPWTFSWITSLGIGYRLQCCACTRGKKKVCKLCKHRQDHAALCARDTLATIQYTHNNLLNHAPWDTRGGEVQEEAKRSMAMRFKPDFLDHRREFSRNDKKQIISCCSVTKLLGSVYCNSGEQTYYEVKLRSLGGIMRLGWQGGGSTWLFDLVRKQFSSHLQTFESDDLLHAVRKHLFCLQTFEGDNLLHAVSEETWNVEVSKDDVIGLACDLQNGKIHVSCNGNWLSQSMTIDIKKVSCAAPCNSVVCICLCLCACVCVCVYVFECVCVYL